MSRVSVVLSCWEEDDVGGRISKRRCRQRRRKGVRVVAKPQPPLLLLLRFRTTPRIPLTDGRNIKLDIGRIFAFTGNIGRAIPRAFLGQSEDLLRARCFSTFSCRLTRQRSLKIHGSPQLQECHHPPPCWHTIIIVQHLDLVNIEVTPSGLQIDFAWISQFGAEYQLIADATACDEDQSDHVLKEGVRRRSIGANWKKCQVERTSSV